MNNPKVVGKKILIADDDPAIVDALQFLLEAAGFTVEATIHGDKVQKMIDNQPDLLLLDVRMPGTDGRQICKMIKGQSRTKNIPVIMFSANDETEQLSRQAGADDFLSKPFGADELLQKLSSHLN